MNVLIAENSMPSRTLLKTILFSMNLIVVEAENGEDAWNKLQIKNPPKIVLLDLDLPIYSGLELAKMIRDKEKDSDLYTYIIIISSPKNREKLRFGIDIDVDNYLTLPIENHTLFDTLKVANKIINQQEYLYNIQKKLKDQLKKQESEIKKAQEIQQILNTTVLPKTEMVNIEAVYNPSEGLGGDFFTIIKTPRNNLAVIMVDCTGHGLEASMYATLLKSICDRHTSLLDNPSYLSTFVQMVNIDVAGYITSDQFPVMFVSVYVPMEKKYYYSSANGEYPYLIRGNKAHKLLRTEGIHLGYNTETQYHIKSFLVKDGDIIFFYSDAIIEIKNASWDRRDDTILKEELVKKSTNLRQYNANIMKFIDSNAGDTILDDDLSLIYFQIKEPSYRTTHINSIDEVTTEVDNLRTLLNNFNYTEDEIEQSNIAFKELLLNSLIHGNENRKDRKVIIESVINCKDFYIKIEDQGSGFNKADVPDPTDFTRLELLLKNNDEEGFSHGRGIWLARNLTDSIVYNSKGNVVTMTKNKRAVKSYNNYKVTELK